MFFGTVRPMGANTPLPIRSQGPREDVMVPTMFIDYICAKSYIYLGMNNKRLITLFNFNSLIITQFQEEQSSGQLSDGQVNLLYLASPDDGDCEVKTSPP